MEHRAMTGLAQLALTRGVDRLLDGLQGAWDGPGAAIGVVQAGALAVHRCAGLASLELGAQIGPETTFRVASVTKQFTCARYRRPSAGAWDHCMANRQPL